LGPAEALGVHDCVLILETSTLVAIICRRVCCCWLPAYRPMEAGPNDASKGALLSSCQVIDTGWPAGREEVAMGLVT